VSFRRRFLLSFGLGRLSASSLRELNGEEREAAIGAGKLREELMLESNAELGWSERELKEESERDWFS